MNKIIKITLSVAVIAALGVAGAKAVKKAKAKDAAQPQAKIYPIVVNTLAPKVSHVTLTLPYLASVANDKDVMLSSRIAARIISLKHSGEKVRRGEVIARLDTTTIQSNLIALKNQLKAVNVALSNLQSTHKRTEDLLKVKGASIEQSQKEGTMIAQTEAKIVSLEQKISELKHNLSYAVITSPVNGVIAKSMASEGAMSMPGKPLVKISAKNGFYLLVRVPTDTPIKGVVFEGKKYDATALGSTFHSLAEYKVYVDKTDLTSGDRVEVSVVTYDDNGILLPFDALLNRDGKNYVLALSDEGNRASAQEVKVIQSAEEGVVVANQFKDEKIVVAKPDILLKLTTGYALSTKE